MRKFLNDIVKPWDELNQLLSQRYAFDPEVSDISRLAGGLMTAIRHQVDVVGWTKGKQPTVPRQAPPLAHQLVLDAADFWKHGTLDNPNRNNSINVVAMFEYEQEQGFRFIRNGLFIEHATHAEHDLMEAMATAIHFWINVRGLDIQFDGKLQEATQEFGPVAYLNFNPQLCIEARSTRFKFFSRSFDGALFPVDPPDVRIAIY